MNAVPAQEIKTWYVAVDELIDKWVIFISGNNQPQYVVLSEERYAELIEAEECVRFRVRAALEDPGRRGYKRFSSAEELLHALDSARMSHKVYTIVTLTHFGGGFGNSSKSIQI